MDPSTVFATFDVDQLAQIWHYHCTLHLAPCTYPVVMVTVGAPRTAINSFPPLDFVFGFS